jgi:hypothetical protein
MSLPAFHPQEVMLAEVAGARVRRVSHRLDKDVIAYVLTLLREGLGLVAGRCLLITMGAVTKVLRVLGPNGDGVNVCWGVVKASGATLGVVWSPGVEWASMDTINVGEEVCVMNGPNGGCTTVFVECGAEVPRRGMGFTWGARRVEPWARPSTVHYNSFHRAGGQVRVGDVVLLKKGPQGASGSRVIDLWHDHTTHKDHALLHTGVREGDGAMVSVEPRDIADVVILH